MNFKKFHESKNLFDKDTATIYEATIASSGSWATGNGATVRIPVTPSTTYTLHTNSVQSVFRITEITSDTLPTVNGNLIIRSSNIDSCTFTTSENAKFIVFQGAIDTTQQWIQELMLNTGSQPLPYEPYSSEVWHDTPHYIHNTSTDTITTLPAVLYPNDTTATVGLKGNMSQTGTPTPTTPIQPQETGERTGNLFDKDSNTLNNNGQIRPGVDVPAGIYSISNGTPNWVYYRVGVQGTTRQISAGSNAENINASDTLYVWRDANIRQDGVMLNTGETALPYEPYGYKIPISSANTTTPVYLGEVETTRKIKKLVLDGTENWNEGTSNYYIFINISGKGEGIPNSTALSTHTESGVVVDNNGTALFFKKSVFVHSSLADFKTYLQQQYSAGTPVTVWYVLATPTTGIVNEPIRKIGDYADEVSGITIPTIAGANTISIGTTLQPSEVTVNYKGWHPVQSVHEAENGQWD